MKTFEHIAEEMLHIPKEKIGDDLTPKDVPDWDSMNYLLFIAELERAFKMSFSMDEVMNAKSLGDVRKIVEARKK
ncbi:MAG: acyl carrier protein [Patescibacteria group bacterium]|nr:acyl carrier protein [Patescibacteria group bacterium]MDE1946241.1 acyl carrier protein [Patescibacteria group bacterium]